MCIAESVTCEGNNRFAATGGALPVGESGIENNFHRKAGEHDLISCEMTFFQAH